MPEAKPMAPSCTDGTGAIAPDAPMTQIEPVNGTSEENVPPFTHFISAIFVPLKEDLLKPIEPPKDREERLQRMRAGLDANEKAVRENLAWMFEREARRRVAEAKRTRPLSEPHEPSDIDWEEGEKLLANMSQPANPMQTYHISPEKLSQPPYIDPIAVAFPAGLSPHETTVREVLFVACNGSNQIELYSKGHMKGIRDRLNTSIAREESRW